MVYHHNFKKAFTLIEVIIVVGIFSLLGSISVVTYKNYQSANNLEVATQSVVESIRYAKSNAETNKENSNWGVKILTDQVILFKGDSYATRDADFDRNLEFPADVNPSGLDEIVFEKVFGVTVDVGTTTMTGPDNFKEININEKGTINY